MSRVTPQIRRLLEAPLDTFEKLEICMVLWTATARTQSPRELAARVQLPVELVDRALEDLVAAGYVELAGGLARLTVPTAQHADVQALVELYAVDRILIVRTLSELAMNRVRSMAARAFADAFQLRRKPEGDDG
ncbi:MAG: hypothetical protein JNL83_30380 [Myxococcales bacterium]|nr:hypothetical protein [Myxococcales bacterium]